MPESDLHIEFYLILLYFLARVITYKPVKQALI